MWLDGQIFFGWAIFFVIHGSFYLSLYLGPTSQWLFKSKLWRLKEHKQLVIKIFLEYFNPIGRSSFCDQVESVRIIINLNTLGRYSMQLLVGDWALSDCFQLGAFGHAAARPRFIFRVRKKIKQKPKISLLDQNFGSAFLDFPVSDSPSSWSRSIPERTGFEPVRTSSGSGRQISLWPSSFGRSVGRAIQPKQTTLVAIPGEKREGLNVKFCRLQLRCFKLLLKAPKLKD